MEDKAMLNTTAAAPRSTSRRDESSLAELFEALGPFRAVLGRMSQGRTQRLAPIVLRAIGTLMTDAEVVVVPPGPEGVTALGDEVLDLLSKLLREGEDLDGRLAVLDAVSDVVGRLDSTTFEELQKTGL